MIGCSKLKIIFAHLYIDNYPTSQNPQPYPPTQPPPGYDAHQHPYTEPQSVQVNIYYLAKLCMVHACIHASS